MPMPRGRPPIAIVATTSLLVPSMTETVSSLSFVTKIRFGGAGALLTQRNSSARSACADRPLNEMNWEDAEEVFESIGDEKIVAVLSALPEEDAAEVPPAPDTDTSEEIIDIPLDELQEEPDKGLTGGLPVPEAKPAEVEE